MSKAPSMSNVQKPLFRVINCRLPPFAAPELEPIQRWGSGTSAAPGQFEREIVPVLVDNRTGLPCRLPLRWVMRDRRVSVSEKTLTDDLRAAATFYRFAVEVLGISTPDETFADGVMFSPRNLARLIENLRGGADGQPPKSLCTVGHLAGKLEALLIWLADVPNRGGQRPIAAADLVLYRDRLSATFGPLKA
jgi:hypothetical protein